MNSFSWMIYLADVVGKIGGLLFAVVFAYVVLSALFALIGAGIRGDNRLESPEWEAGRRLQTAPLKYWPLALACALAATLIPSSGTIYAIAASEMGERALNTPTAGKAVKALNAWLDRQIAGDAEPSK